MNFRFDSVKFLHDSKLYNEHGSWQDVVIEQFIPELLKVIKSPSEQRHYIFLDSDKKMSLPLANNVRHYLNSNGYHDIKLIEVGDGGYTIQVILDFSK